MNENEPKLDGYEPMNMEQKSVEVMTPSPIPTESIDALDVPDTKAENIDNVGEAINNSLNVEINDSITLGNSDGSQINQNVTLEQTPNLGDSTLGQVPDTGIAPAENQTVPIENTFFQNPVDNSNIASNPVMSQASVEPINTPINSNAAEDVNKKKSKLPFIIIILVVIVALGVGVYFLFFKKAGNPYTITTTIFDELASSSSEIYDNINSFVFPVNGKPVSSGFELSVNYGDKSFSGKMTTTMDASKKMMGFESNFNDGTDFSELNGLITKDAMYFNSDSLFGTNYKFSYDFEELFEISEEDDDGKYLVNLFIKSYKDAFTKVFTEDDFVSSNSGNYTKYHLTITGEAQYEMLNYILSSIKSDKMFEEYMMGLLNDNSEAYDSLFVVDDKEDYIDGAVAVNYDIYMDKLELKKIELSVENSFVFSVSFDSNKTTIYISSLDVVSSLVDVMPVSNLLADKAEDGTSMFELTIINSKDNINIDFKNDDEELIFDWEKGSKYSISLISGEKTKELVTGTLKIKNSVNIKSFDLTFKSSIDEEKTIEGFLKIENKQIDSFDSTVPQGALDIEDEENKEKFMEEFGFSDLFNLMNINSNNFDDAYSENL